MKQLKKLCAVVLAFMLILGSMSGVLGVTVFAETATETVTVTELPRLHLKEQMRTIYADAVAAATEAGKTVSRDSALNQIISITQSDPWHVYGTTAAANSWSDTKGYFHRYDSSSNLDLRYGHSYWSYTTASIRVSYKGGSASNGEALTALLRPQSGSTDERKNAYIGLYYVAEVSGEYHISDNFGGFIVRNTAAEGYNAYVTIYANGKEIYKSVPLSRVNRMAKFDGATVDLQKGDKIEYRFTYEATAEDFGGDIEFDFDPKITLLSQADDIVINGTGSLAQKVYDEMLALDATGNKTGVSVTQTGPWKAQIATSLAATSWKDISVYYNGSKSDNGDIEWGYNSYSYSQNSEIAVKHVDNSTTGDLYLQTFLPLHYGSNWQRYPVRYAYTAEHDGRYTLSDEYNQFIVQNETALTVFEAYVQITLNSEVKWKSQALTTTGQTVDFDGITLDLKAGDVLAIEFIYAVQEGQTNGSDSTKFRIRFDPVLSYKKVESPVSYNVTDAYNELFAGWEMAEGDAAISGTLTQPTTGWIFEKGVDAGSLVPFTHYYYSGGDTYWGYKTLGVSSDYNGGSYPGVFINIGLGNGISPARGKLFVRYRGCTQSSGIQSSHEYAKDFSYSFIAPDTGTYLLSEVAASLDVDATNISDTIVKIYKNSSLVYESDILNNANQSVTIPEMSFRLDANDKVIIYFERQLSASVVDWNNNIRVVCDPTITYIPSSNEEIEKAGYTPEQTERYYAENITAPVAFSAWVNTNDVFAGDIFSSDNLTLSVNNGGYPVISYGEKEIPFTFDIRGNGWVHIAVSYNAEAGIWTLYYNGLAATTVADSDYVAADIAKLYVGASMDAYNNSYFKGSVAEMAFFTSALTADSVTEIYNAGVTAEDAAAYFELSDVTAETSLIKEVVSVPSQDRDDNGIAFTSQNQRLDLYEKFDISVNTFEAWVRLETAFVDGVDAGVITSTAHIDDDITYGSAPCVTLRIGANGKPTLVFVDESTTSIVFDTDIRSDDWVHLAISADYEAGYYYCYINGEFVDKKATTGTEIPVTIRPYVVNGNYFHRDIPHHFQGDIAGISMFSDARTQSEILDDIYGVDINDSNLLGSWYIDDATEDQPNRNGDGNDLHSYWAKSADEVVDESFGDYSTFVFIPDTQNFVQGEGAAAVSTISNWILENKESENIVGVMGLGDITNLNTTSQWADAAKAFEPLKGQIPFVFTSGNHDIEFKNPSADNPRDVTNFNTYFPYADWAPYMSGFYEEGKIDNMYYLLEDVNGVKYMMLGLEFQPRDAVLEWASNVIEEHSDYKVIIATHGYQDHSYETSQNYYISSNGYEDVVGTDSNVGSEIWEKLVSQHENIQAVFCGHVKSDVHYTTNTGINGNVVTEIIANAQSVDNYMRMSGMILIFRVSEDGTKANINYYSPYHDHYLRDLNQFTIDWIDDEYEEETVIGDITGDGAVNAEDLSSLRIKLMTNNEYDALYDVNKDGYFNIKDLVRLKKLCAGISSEGIAVTEGEVTIDEKINIGYVSTDSDAVVASGTAVVTIDGGSYNGGWGASNTAVWAKEDATVIINDGTFTVGADANGDYNDLIYARDNAKVEIYGGFFESEVPWSNNGKYYVLNVRNDSNATITVYGGTFVNFNPADGDDVVEGAITVAEGYEVVAETQANGDIWYTVVKN